jgi:hypothetical protein
MKLICPRCRDEIPPEDINVAGNLAHCKACNEAFALAGDDVARVERPANARAMLLREPERLAVAFPRGGFKGVGCFFTFFALFWNAITWTFVVVMLAELLTSSSGQPQAVSKGFGAFGLLFLIPFVVIGLVTAVIALYCLFGETTLALDRERGVLQRKLFRWKHEKGFLVADITAVRIAEAYKQNERPVYGVGIVLRDKRMPLVFASHLAEDEKAWLVGEVHAFWKEMTRAM